MQKLYTLEEVAEHCRVSVRAVHHWIATERLKGTFLVGTKRVVPEPSLEKFLADAARRPAPRRGFASKRHPRNAKRASR